MPTVGGLVKEAIARLRLKLVDLTNRNRLLNFKLSETSRKSVRVVDELPDALFARLNHDPPTSSRLYFAPLPEPSEEEMLSLTSAQDVNAAAPAAGAQSSGAPPGDPGRRWGRRKSAGTNALIDVNKWAMQQGINPSYELPKPDSAQSHSKHIDNEIQTMLFSDALEKKLGGIREEANLAWQEAGVKTLYVAFGFLEWFEADDSEEARYSPLYLLPVDIDRDIRANRYRYYIESAEEAEPVINVSLQERLKRDFALQLPPIAEDEAPESYFNRVEKAVRSQKRWTLRRFLVVGHFSFARLVMYQDLAPDHWSQLEANPLISSLLAGSEESDESTHAGDFDVDDEKVEKHVPVLIADADSSQFSAIVDAMQGRSFALKGPPGTGKSQTITNLIAAALAAGKSVLFVAEKQAALQVVSDRLKKAKLNPFLLELHSTKIQKKAVLEGLEERLKVARGAGDGRLEECLLALRKSRSQLKSYVDLLNKCVGQSGTTLHDLYWHDQRLRRELDTAELKLIGTVSIESAATLSPNAHAERKLLTGRFANSYSTVTSEWGTIDKHPWFGINSPGQAYGSYHEIHSRLAAWHKILSRIEKAIARSKDLFGIELPTSAAAASKVCSALANLPSFRGDIRPDVLRLIGSESDIRELAIFIDCNQRLLAARAELQKTFTDIDGALSQEQTLNPLSQSLYGSARRLGLVDTVLTGIPEQLLLRRHEVEQIEASLLILHQFAKSEGLQIESSSGWEEHCVSAVRFLQTIPQEVLNARKEALYKVEARRMLERLLEESIELRAVSDRLRASFNLSDLDDPAALLEAAAVFRETPAVIRFFSSKYRAARDRWRRIAKDRWRGSHAEAQRLTEVSEFLLEKHTFERYQPLKDLAGASFAGIDTQFQTLILVVDYWEAVRMRWPSLDPARQPFQRLLLNASADRLWDLHSSFDDRTLAQIDSFRANAANGAPAHLFVLTSEIKSALAELSASVAPFLKLPLTCPMSVADLVAQFSQLAPINTALKQRAASRFADCIPQDDRSSSAFIAKLADTLTFGEQIIGAQLPAELKLRLLNRKPQQSVDAAKRYGQIILDGILSAEDIRNGLVKDSGLLLTEWAAVRGSEALSFSVLRDRVKFALSLKEEDATDWVNHRALEQQLESAGLSVLGRAIREGQLRIEKCTQFYELIYVRSLINETVQRFPKLPSWTGDHIESLRKRLVQLDNDYLRLSHGSVAATLSLANVPAGVSQGAVSAKTERSLIEHEIGKQKKHISIRELLRRAPTATRALKPCFMMSPASVAQFLPQGQHSFDIVVIDEASQMRPEDALGAIARGKQAIVVGDPMQLPPTAFFDSNSDEEESSGEEELDIDTESVLDMAISSYRPFRELRWHYRSRHHSLISFSNREFYRDNLIVFPSPQENTKTLGVNTVLVDDGIYRSSLNVIEAEQVIKTVSDLMRSRPSSSIGVVAINQPQQRHLAELFDRLFAEDEELEEYRARWAGTLGEFFVKNLENVQGDERDVIVISTVYGRAAPSAEVMQRFGPINTRSGHRRLNVLFTRAKERVVLVTSLRPEDIKPAAGGSRGQLAFKNYLEFARSGRLDAGKPTGGEFDSPFEAEVADVLERLGYKAEPQVGVAGYFIDLGVRHLVHHDHFILGIECDGANYHSAKSARDRDRLRQSVLEGLGWKLYRIWSTDWFHARDRQVNRLSEYLKQMEAAGSPFNAG